MGKPYGQVTLDARSLVEMLRAAGEPTRLRVLSLLAREELSVMEIGQILGHSQPRVSRHLKLLTQAGLVERFPDGAWVFYRLASASPQRRLMGELLSMIRADDATMECDLERLEAVRRGRLEEASAYFARNAARWDEIRSLYVSEADVEAAILAVAGPGPFQRVIDLGTGAGRMLTLLGPRAEAAIGLDLSQQMLNIARSQVADAGLKAVELRHGDIYVTGLPDGSSDLVVVHRVLHFLGDPAGAVTEAARLLARGGRLLIVDFAPHALESLREAHQHRRLGFSDAEIIRWLEQAGLSAGVAASLPPSAAGGLTVKLWSGERA